jgi:hypothetical protein
MLLCCDALLCSFILQGLLGLLLHPRSIKNLSYA